MDGYLMLKAGAAFIFVLTLMLLLPHALKRIGFHGQLGMPGTKRRLGIVEYISIDHKRKLVLVRRDNREHLLVLGPESETLVEANIPAVEDNVVVIAPKEPKNVQG